MVYTTDGPLPTANGIAFTTAGLVFDPQQVNGGLVTKIIAGANITVSGDGTGEVTISSTGGGGGGAVDSVSVAGNNLTVNSTTGDVVITSTVAPQFYGTSSFSIGPSAVSPGSNNGGNTFVGALAGQAHGGTNGLSTYVGSNSGKNVVGGNQNVFVGAMASNHPLTSGNTNTLIGYNTGSALSSSVTLQTMVGGHQGYPGTQGEVIIGRNSNFLRLNTNNALCFGGSINEADFGNAGEVLTSQGSGDSPVWSSIPTASTTAAGIVQLNDSVSSTSTSQALTANQGKVLQDQINTLLVSGELVLAGTFNASAGTMVSVSSNGSGQGFTVGGTLPAPAVGNNNYFVITVVPGSYSPTGGGGPYTMTQGDWLLSNGSAWAYFNVGYDPQPASTTDAGVVALSTDTLTQAGVDATTAVTPASLQSKLSDSVASTSSTTIASSNAVNTVEVAAQAAQADATQAISNAAAAQTDATQALADAAAAQTDATQAITDAAAAQTTADAAIPESIFTDGGQLLTSSAAGVAAVEPAGTTYQVLRSQGTSGVIWANVGAAVGSITVNNQAVTLDNFSLRFNATTQMFEFTMVSGSADLASAYTIIQGGSINANRWSGTYSSGTWTEFSTTYNLTTKGDTLQAVMWYKDATSPVRGYSIYCMKGSSTTGNDNIINITRIA